MEQLIRFPRYRIIFPFVVGIAAALVLGSDLFSIFNLNTKIISDNSLFTNLNIFQYIIVFGLLIILRKSFVQLEKIF